MGKAIIKEVPAHAVDLFWPITSKLLERAVDRNYTLEIDDAYNLAKDGICKLLIAANERGIFAAFLIERVKGIRRSFLRILLAGGEPMEEWQGPFKEYMDNLTKSENLDFYELIGRPGWKRALKGLGYESNVIYRRDVG